MVLKTMEYLEQFIQTIQSYRAEIITFAGGIFGGVLAARANVIIDIALSVIKGKYKKNRKERIIKNYKIMRRMTEDDILLLRSFIFANFLLSVFIGLWTAFFLVIYLRSIGLYSSSYFYIYCLLSCGTGYFLYGFIRRMRFDMEVSRLRKKYKKQIKIHKFTSLNK